MAKDKNGKQRKLRPYEKWQKDLKRKLEIDAKPPSSGWSRADCKLTPELTKQVVAAVKGGNYPSVATTYFSGGNDKLYFRWMAKGRAESERLETDPEAEIPDNALKYLNFYLEVEKAKAWSEMRAVQIIMQPQENDAVDLKWAAWWLEKARRDNWAQSHDVNIHGPGNGPIQVEASVEHDITSDLTGSEIESIAEILIRAENRRLAESVDNEPAVPLPHGSVEADRPGSVSGQLAHPADSGISSAGDAREAPETDN